MRIGVVSDTHDRILPELFEALAGVDEILHAGDVCTEDALAEIESLAPVTAVHGNMDEGPLSRRLPDERIVERGGVRIVLVHGHRLPRGDLDALADHCRPMAPAIAVFGHIHEPVSAVRAGIHCFNPGTAGGIGRAPTAGILTIQDGAFTLLHVDLG